MKGKNQKKEGQMKRLEEMAREKLGHEGVYIPEGEFTIQDREWRVQKVRETEKAILFHLREKRYDSDGERIEYEYDEWVPKSLPIRVLYEKRIPFIRVGTANSKPFAEIYIGRNHIATVE